MTSELRVSTIAAVGGTSAMTINSDGATALTYQYRGETPQYQLNFARFEQGIKSMQSLLVNKYDYEMPTYKKYVELEKKKIILPKKKPKIIAYRYYSKPGNNKKVFIEIPMCDFKKYESV